MKTPDTQDSTFSLTARGPFELASAARFGAGFSPSPSDATGGGMQLALSLEHDGWRSVGLELVPAARGLSARVVAAGGSPAPAAATGAARRQLTRILSLDVDGRGFPAVGERDPVVAGLQARFPGLRPVLFHSPYEAAAWAIIGQRIRMSQASDIRARLAQELGEPVRLGSRTLPVFPAPPRLARLEAPSPGLTERKVAQLRSLAEAALGLQAEGLRTQPRDEALAALQLIPGIGPFSAELVLIRGAGEPDHFPEHERRLRSAMQAAYGLPDDAGAHRFAEIAEGWRPYRSWVALLLRARLDETGARPGTAP